MDKKKTPKQPFFKGIKEDFKNYDKINENEEKVFKSKLFSSYKGTFVLKTPFRSSFSFGIIALSKRQQNAETLKHEYGHRLQLRKMGLFKYIKRVAIPSVKAYRLHRKGKLTLDYYGSPWEHEADALGNVNRKTNNTPWQIPQNTTATRMLKQMK